MAKGDQAKNAVIETIKAAFGNDYIDIVDKKIYVWAKEGAEKIQIAISLTSPKTPISINPTIGSLDFGGGLDFEAMSTGEAIPEKTVEITQEEQDNISALFARLGL